MASSAAVAADIARPANNDNDLGEDHGGAGEITSAILPLDQPAPDLNDDEDDEDDDIQATARRRGQIERVNGAVDGEEEEAAGNDLFGDEDDGDAAEPPKRQLDDEELDSGDDEGRDDRLADEAQAEQDQQETVGQDLAILEVELPRQAGPQPSDGEMYLMKVPRFLSVEPKAWSHLEFQPPVTDHHSKGHASATFSAYNTALSTLRWRRSPSNPSELQSNARILRWSDGSLTLQLASDPSTQYDVDGNPLAPPQRNPIKPTPTSLKAGQKGIAARGEKYNPSQDSFTYLLAPAQQAEVLRVSHKITAGLKVLPSAEKTDDALERLQNSLAAAANATKTNGVGGSIEVLRIDEDPDLQRKKAEVAEREKMRARKRREAQEERERERSNRTLGRHGLSTGRFGAGGGLTAGLLEDDDMGGASGRPRAAKPRKRTQRRNSEYSEDEDFGRRGFGGKQDEYDREDDFLAASDEEEEVGEDDDEDEEDIDDGIVEERRERTPKRERPRVETAVIKDVEEDVAGDESAVRSKRRRIVDEEDEDE